MQSGVSRLAIAEKEKGSPGGLPFFWLWVRLEVVATAELQGAGRAEAGDVAEGAARHGGIRVGGELWVVEQVEGFHANLELAFAPDVEAAKDAGVDVGYARATELIAVRVGEEWAADLGRRCCCAVGGFRRIGEGSWVEPRTAAADAAVAGRAVVPPELHIGFHQLCVFGVARRVDG